MPPEAKPVPNGRSFRGRLGDLCETLRQPVSQLM